MNISSMLPLIAQFIILFIFSVMTERYFKLGKSLAFAIQYLPYFLRIKRYKEPQELSIPLLFICDLFAFFVYAECFIRFSHFVRLYLIQLSMR